MLLSTSEIIEETNEIALGLYNGARKNARSLTVHDAQELRVAAMHAASRTMQVKIMAAVIDMKSFHWYKKRNE